MLLSSFYATRLPSSCPWCRCRWDYVFRRHSILILFFNCKFVGTMSMLKTVDNRIWYGFFRVFNDSILN